MEYSFKWAQLSAKPTQEELKREIKKLEILKADQANMDSALKININSSYGVLGLVSFICYNKDVAQTITMQSENLLKTTITYFDNYFLKVLPTKVDLMKKLGVTEVPPYVLKKYPDYKADDPQLTAFDAWYRSADSRSVNYADTDSLFIVFDSWYKASDRKMHINKWFHLLYEEDFKVYLEDKMTEYCNDHNAFTHRPDGKPSLMLELENICYSVLMTSKKHYIKNISFGKGKDFKPRENLVIKGLEANKSATPTFCRAKLKEMINYVMEHGNNIDGYKLSVLVKNIKEQFKKVHLEEVCKTERVGDYDKFVANDTTFLEFKPNAGAHVKGAAYYNYGLGKRDDIIKSKYQRISMGTKVRWYYTKEKSDVVDSFAFLPGSFPEEFAPQIDYDIQFEKTFLNPLNTILVAMGIKQLDPEQVYFSGFGW